MLQEEEILLWKEEVQEDLVDSRGLEEKDSIICPDLGEEEQLNLEHIILNSMRWILKMLKGLINTEKLNY